LPHEVVFRLARDRRPAAAQVSVAPYHMGVFYRDTTSVSCLFLDSRAPRLQDVSLSTFQSFPELATLARDLRNLSHLDSHW